MHILSTENFIPHHLNVGPKGGPKQQQRHGIVHLKLGIAAPQNYKGQAHRHEAPKDAAQQDKLQPPSSTTKSVISPMVMLTERAVVQSEPPH